eukprot:TRINITY_DN10008_c0_g1_i1.p1 TRINITY_DN10008_c0_g1~~TRINITY_DN10008_c0_g1_i1.p1  ORF type:complete len:247 (+),score=73.09 TRINITY_DN10008_c0_g1_i1:32-742(+)
MTTSHRPTWNPAVGGSHQGGVRIHAPSAQFSARDLPGHTKLKTRQPGQNTKEEIKERNFREELEEKERKASKGLLLDDKKPERKNSDVLLLEDSQRASDREKQNLKKIAQQNNIDADDEDDDSASDASSAESESDDDDDDEEAELLKELEKIKAERAAEQERKKVEEIERVEKERDDSVVKGNPLINQDSFLLKRKWFDDSVFKNQSRTQPIVKKRFINDTIRNDFHRRFLDRYIQ